MKSLFVRLSLGIIFLWLVALGFFLHLVYQDNQVNPEPADAIVILTGGQGRLAEGLRLLMTGQGHDLFISGVGEQTTFGELMKKLPELQEFAEHHQDPAWQQLYNEKLTCCVFLGYQAKSTIGNAREVADWMRSKNYQSMKLVTSNYHMPRALAELHSIMPTLRIDPNPVAKDVSPDNTLDWPWLVDQKASTKLLIEFHKYIYASIRLMMKS